MGKITQNTIVTARKGFTLIELLIAIAIIGIMMMAVIPMLRKEPGYERKQFVARLNALVQFAWQQSIITRIVHRVLFNFKERQASVERMLPVTTAMTTTQKFDFELAKGPNAYMTWPTSISIKQFFVEGFDEMKRFSGRGAQTIWFYVIPDGMTQQVTINSIDREDMFDNKPRQFGLVLNPFLAQFKEYDTFQK